MSGRLLSGVAAVSALSLTLLLASCGGAGGGGSSVADGGIRGTGSSVGPVSGFSSIIVNGIRFVTENLGIDDFVGEAGVPTEDDLEKGMILQIRGEWQDGQGEADSVRYDDTLRGPVTDVPEPWDGIARQGRIEVMGFAVTLDRLTQTTLADLASINVGDRLRVSGWLQADGSFRASYIGAPLTSEGTEEIEGFLSVSGDEPNQRYAVGDLEITISEGSVCEELEELVDGTVVDVEGRYEGAPARFVAEENGLCTGPAEFLTASLDQDVQVAGVVTEGFTGNPEDGRFALNGIPVITNEETDFDDLEPADISNGRLLQAEGRYISDNGVLTLRAEEIENRDADAEVEGRLDEIDGSTLRVGGVEIRLSPFTIRDDDDDESCPAPFGPENVENIELEVAGIQRTADGGYLEALEIECENEVDELGYELEGRIDEVINIGDDRRRILILGTSLLVDGNTDFGDSDASVDGLAAGDHIEAEYSGPPVNGDYIVGEIEVESEEEADSDDD